MIDIIVKSISERLDEFIRGKLSVSESKVVVSNLVDISKSVNIEIENKLAVFLLNIEEDKTAKNLKFQKNQTDPPSVTVNIYIMFAAYFNSSGYLDSLRYISLVIEFFQANNVFTPLNTPSEIDNMFHVEIYNVSIEEINKLWANIGTNYVPSVAYKIKQVVFDSNLLSGITSRIGS
tara:strand:- start:39419 stop:39949 length:531 start_codon:yes stop_codon:yes gene_type:complete